MTDIVSFMIMMTIWYRAAGVLTNKTNTYVCQGLTANIDFTIDLQGSTIGTGSASWYLRSTRIATNPLGIFTPQGNYSSRLSPYLTYGFSLTNVTSADEGEYTLLFTVILPAYEDVTANAALTVIVAPTSSCVPYYGLTGNTGRCFLNQTALSDKKCGSPVLQSNWTNGLLTSDITNISTSGNYTCCAYGIARNCYNGSYTFCETFSITVSTSTTAKTTSEMTSTPSAALSQATHNGTNNQHQTSPPSTTKSQENESGKDNKQIIIISVSVSGGIILLGVAFIIIWCKMRQNKTVDKVVATKDGKHRHRSPSPQYTDGREGNEFTESNPNKEISSAQIHLSVFTSNHTFSLPQDGKDKPLAKEIKEVKQTNL